MTDTLIEGIAWYVAFLFSVTLHEAAHSWLAKRGGDLTAYHGGQVSLDPLPHIRREPIGMVLLPILSLVFFHWPFGFASAPYDPYWADRHPRRAAWMALAGPASNFLMVLVSAALIRIGMLAGHFDSPDSVGYAAVTAASGGGLWTGLAMLVSMLFSLNLILTVLNLIPLPPLDGSGALPLVLSEAVTRRYHEFSRQPAFQWIGLLVAWNLFGPIFRPIFLLAVNLLYPGSHYAYTAG